MNFQLVISIVVGVCSLASLSTAQKPAQCAKQCFDCTLCDYKCHQECDNQFTSLLCTLLIQQCRSDHGCNRPSTNITLYPANDFNVNIDPVAFEPLTLSTRPNCCYELTDKYDKTLSNIKTNGACVTLYSGHGCTGTTLKVDRSNPCYAARSSTNVITLDCPGRTGPLWNDVASSLQLC